MGLPHLTHLTHLPHLPHLTHVPHLTHLIHLPHLTHLTHLPHLPGTEWSEWGEWREWGRVERVGASGAPPYGRNEILAVFSKSLSSCLHGTCLLSVLSLFLDGNETNHPDDTPIPKSVILSQSCAWRASNETQNSHRGSRFVPGGLRSRLCWYNGG